MKERAGFPPRLAAFALDIVIGLAPGYLFGGALGGLFGFGAAAVARAASGDAGAVPAGLELGFIYGVWVGHSIVYLLYSFIEALTGASPGKMLMKLRIRLQDGSQAPTLTYVVRWALKNSFLLFQLVALATGLDVFDSIATLAGYVVFGGCLLVIRSDRQAMHDRIVKTAVFKWAELI